MYLIINKCVTAVKVSNFSCHYLRNRSTLDIGVLGYIGIVQHKEHSPEVFHIPPGTPCIYINSLRVNNVQLMLSIKPLHVWATGCHPQSLTLVMNCILLSEFVRRYIDCENMHSVSNVKYLLCL